MATVTAPTSRADRLAELCEAAGYTQESRDLIAETLFLDYTPGAPLSEQQLEQLCWAVEVLAQGGRDAQGVAVTVGHWRDTGNPGWRDEFWAATIQTAKLRFSQPDQFGLSPLETDPKRLAEHQRVHPGAETPAGATTMPAVDTPPPSAPGTPIAPDRPARPLPLSQPVSGLELVRQIPRVLPLDYKGDPITHLSLSSMMKFVLCPDDWRRHYLKGERGARSGAMLLGTCVDGALGVFYQQILEGSAPLGLAEMQDAFRDLWEKTIAEEAQHGGVAWEDGLSANPALEIGLEAVEVTLERIVPRLGRPLSTQRKFELRLAPDVDWVVLGYVDLDSVRTQRVYLDEEGRQRAIQDPGDAEPTVTMDWADAPADLRPDLKPKRTRGKKVDPEVLEDPPPVQVPLSRLRGEIVERDVTGVVDYKVKRKPIYQTKADADAQATLYLAERALVAAADVHDFTFAQVAKASEGDRRHASATVIRTTRTRPQMLGVFVRIAQVAAQINANYEQFGPDKVWGYPEPGAWKCTPTADGSRGKFCVHYDTCAMGRGLPVTTESPAAHQ